MGFFWWKVVECDLDDGTELCLFWTNMSLNFKESQF